MSAPNKTPFQLIQEYSKYERGSFFITKNYEPRDQAVEALKTLNDEQLFDLVVQACSLNSADALKVLEGISSIVPMTVKVDEKLKTIPLSIAMNNSSYFSHYRDVGVPIEEWGPLCERYLALIKEYAEKRIPWDLSKSEDPRVKAVFKEEWDLRKKMISRGFTRLQFEMGSL